LWSSEVPQLASYCMDVRVLTHIKKLDDWVGQFLVRVIPSIGSRS
jgi:hypothetical protein